MTVKKLIELLKKMPQDKQVLYDVADTDNQAIEYVPLFGVRQMTCCRQSVLLYYDKVCERPYHYKNGRVKGWKAAENSNKRYRKIYEESKKKK